MTKKLPDSAVCHISIPPYSSLSACYDEGWGKFALSYLPFVLKQIDQRHLQSPRLLDICCGTGLLAKSLAENGIFVVGVDGSPEMIQIARKNCEGISNTEFEACEMTEIAFESEFDIITCTFDSINYLLKSEDILQFFKLVAQALKPGGQFIFDSNTLVSYSSWPQKEYAEIPREINGTRFRQCIKFEPQQSLAEIRFEFPDGVSEVHFQRPWDEKQLRKIISNSGLTTVWIKDNLELDAATELSKRIFMLAERRRS
jgi:SAM-dependent methyltransferase